MTVTTKPVTLALHAGDEADISPEEEKALRQQATFAAQMLGLRSAKNVQLLAWQLLVAEAARRGLPVTEAT